MDKLGEKSREGEVTLKPSTPAPKKTADLQRPSVPLLVEAFPPPSKEAQYLSLCCTGPKGKLVDLYLFVHLVVSCPQDKAPHLAPQRKEL